MRIAVCPGSFDPVTKGHLDIIGRAAGLFDKVIVVVLENYQKTAYFSIEERLRFLRRATEGMAGIEIDSYEGLLAQYAREKGAVAIVKGLRAVSDFEYEFQMSLVNKRLNPAMETIFLNTNAKYLYLSSSLVKQIAAYGGDISEFIPAEIHEDILKGLNEGRA